MKWTVLLSAVLWFPAAACRAEDVVTLATGQDGQGRTRITGTIVEYDGKQLRLRRAAGGETTVPSAQVIDIETTRTTDHKRAGALMEEGKFVEALDAYRQALSAERRPWVQRKIVAQRVRCLQSLARHERACVEFVRLSNADPTDQYLEVIPLSWWPVQPDLSLEETAMEWLQSSSGVERLLGASWLLSVRRGEAIAALQAVSAAEDVRVAHLAAAQLWRTQIVTATADRVKEWQSHIQRMPRNLRAGPYFVLGRALAYQKQHQQAALALMRVPILYGEHRHLAAVALREAASQLEQLNQPGEAAGLYRELIDDYAGFPQAVEAEGRLHVLPEGANN